MVSMIPLPRTSSPSTLITRRASACEPLCARFGDEAACVSAEGIFSPHRASAGGRSGESESCRLRRDEGFVVRSDDGQHRICLVCGEAAALPNALGGAWPHTPKLRAEAHTHSKLRAFLRKRFYPPPAAQLQRGDQSPFEEFPALRGGKRNNSRKVIHYEKRYQIQHAHGVR